MTGEISGMRNEIYGRRPVGGSQLPVAASSQLPARGESPHFSRKERARSGAPGAHLDSDSWACGLVEISTQQLVTDVSSFQTEVEREPVH
jgi:hypothetical protein